MRDMQSDLAEIKRQLLEIKAGMGVRKEYMSLKEAHTYCGLCPETVAKICPTICLDHKKLVKRSDLDAALEARKEIRKSPVKQDSGSILDEILKRAKDENAA